MFKSQPVPTEIPTPTPPSLEDLHLQAGDASFQARYTFQGIITNLVDANARYDDVEVRASSEIDRLTRLREDAVYQRRINTETLAKLQDLIGQE